MFDKPDKFKKNMKKIMTLEHKFRNQGVSRYVPNLRTEFVRHQKESC